LYIRVASHNVTLLNGVHAASGVIDSDYTGEIGVILFNATDREYEVIDGAPVGKLFVENIFIPDFVRDGNCLTLVGDERVRADRDQDKVRLYCFRHTIDARLPEPRDANNLLTVFSSESVVIPAHSIQRVSTGVSMCLHNEVQDRLYIRIMASVLPEASRVVQLPNELVPESAPKGMMNPVDELVEPAAKRPRCDEPEALIEGAIGCLSGEVDRRFQLSKDKSLAKWDSELFVNLINRSSVPYRVEIGDPIGAIVLNYTDRAIYKPTPLEEFEQLVAGSERGAGAYGSTGV
jgi:dUTPase